MTPRWRDVGGGGDDGMKDSKRGINAARNIKKMMKTCRLQHSILWLKYNYEKSKKTYPS